MQSLTDLVKQWIQQDPSLITTLLNISSQLYRENGLQEIQFKGTTFTKQQLPFNDEDFDKYKKLTDFQEPIMNALNRPKVKQLFSFGTLDKFTDKNLDKYIKRVKKQNIDEFILTPKYDGIGMRIYFGEVCLTRHDSQYGLDITHKCKYILNRQKIPKNCVLRGELITQFDHEGFTSKRTYVASHVNDEKPFPKDIEFICYEYLQLDDDNNVIKQTFEQMLQKIDSLFDFKHVVRKINISQLNTVAMDDFKEKIPSEFLSDGVVIRPNNKEYSFEDKEEPSYQVAYKFPSEVFTGKVKEITWNIGQEGFLQPTIHLQTSKVIDNITITKATGVNFDFLYKHNLYPGKTCVVSLKITPRIEGTGKEQKLSKEEFADIIRPEVCPNCGYRVDDDDTSVYRFKCGKYRKQCYKFTLLTRTKKVLKSQMGGFGDKKVKQYGADVNFDFVKWLSGYKYTNKELFMILSDNVGLKTVDEKYTYELLLEWIKWYRLDLKVEDKGNEGNE